MEKKGNKVVMMPGRSANQLASQVAKALRESSGGESNQAEAAQAPAQSPQPLKEAKPAPVKVAPEVASTDVVNNDSLLQFLNPSEIEPSPFQARSTFSEKELNELADSIRNKGVLQPIVVRLQSGGEKYQLIAGERRLRAAEIVGLAEIPAIIQHLSDREALECSIIENAQREDLNPIEEARAFKQLTSEFGLNQSDVAEAVGKNRATISNSLRLLQLDDSVIELLESGDLSAGHGRALCGLPLDEQLQYAKKVLNQNLSVRALEALLKKEDEPEAELDETDEKIQAALRRLETRLVDLIGSEKVNLSMDQEGRKRLSVCFETDASFKRFITKLKS